MAGDWTKPVVIVAIIVALVIFGANYFLSSASKVFGDVGGLIASAVVLLIAVALIYVVLKKR